MSYLGPRDSSNEMNGYESNGIQKITKTETKTRELKKGKSHVYGKIMRYSTTPDLKYTRDLPSHQIDLSAPGLHHTLRAGPLNTRVDIQRSNTLNISPWRNLRRGVCNLNFLSTVIKYYPI